MLRMLQFAVNNLKIVGNVIFNLPFTLPLMNLQQLRLMPCFPEVHVGFKATGYPLAYVAAKLLWALLSMKLRTL